MRNGPGKLRVVPPPAQQAVSTGRGDLVDSSRTNELMPPAHDGMGHSGKVWTSVPPSLKKMMQVIVQSGKYPWETESDIVRWFVYQGLAGMREVDEDPEFTDQHRVLKGWKDVVGRFQEHLMFARSLEEAVVIVDDLRRNGALEKAREMLEKLRASVKLIEDVHWKKLYGEAVRKKLLELGNGK